MTEVVDEVKSTIMSLLGMGIKVNNLPPPKPEYDTRVTFRTVVLTAGTAADGSSNMVAGLLDGPDYNRDYICVFTADTPFVLSEDKATPTDIDDETAGLANPRGALIPTNLVVPLPKASNQVYAFCPLTGTNTCRITVIVTRKIRKLH